MKFVWGIVCFLFAKGVETPNFTCRVCLPRLPCYAFAWRIIQLSFKAQGTG